MQQAAAGREGACRPQGAQPEGGHADSDVRHQEYAQRSAGTQAGQQMAAAKVAPAVALLQGHLGAPWVSLCLPPHKGKHTSHTCKCGHRRELGHACRSVRSVAVDPGNEWFVSGSGDRTIKFWDLASGQLKLTLTGHIEQVTGLAISPRHPFMFSCALDKMVKCWDLEYNKVRPQNGPGLHGLALSLGHPLCSQRPRLSHHCQGEKSVFHCSWRTSASGAGDNYPPSQHSPTCHTQSTVDALRNASQP